MKDLHYLALADAAEFVRTQKISPVALTEACLQRIEALNPKLNAFITVLPGAARAAALEAEKEIQAGNYRGPLHGIPIAFKDMYDTAGVKTTAAFKYFKDRVPEKDAVAVQKLKAAGVILIGKTNLHELAMGTTSAQSFFGAVKNPWHTDYIAGGSSGGSAAAVAAGMCYATIDTDAIGSTRLPAACCGIVGYKCTWGRIDNTGILAGEKAEEIILQLASVGIMARDAVGVMIVADALSGSKYAADSEVRLDSSLRLGIVQNFEADEGVRKVFAAAVEALRKVGYPTVETTAPFEENPDMQNILKFRETANAEIFAAADVLALPTLAHEVLTLAAAGKNPQAVSPQNTFFANYFGLPAISIPCELGGNGLPVGLQLVGRQGEDGKLLQAAEVIQHATRWHEQHPPV
jgi:aspartyl-tRNA(Asn)/glutamyl-tRNA(Gln) amidotransferase subunit A